MKTLEQLPIAVIGAGPVGLAAAAHLTARGLRYVVLEASDGVAASFRSTAHVRLFSPWKMNVDRAALSVLEARGWHAPDPEGMPTAGELRTQYLEPLAAALSPNIRFNVRVERISRRGFDKVKSVGRDAASFVLRVRVLGDASAGHEEEVEARAVIDATGTWSSPNWMGGNGMPALGETHHAAHIAYGMPDILGSERARYIGKRVLVVGSGHSALGSLLALAELAATDPRGHIAWAIRSDNVDRILGGGAKDGLPERGKLGLALRHVIDRGQLELFRALRIDAVTEREGRLQVHGVGPKDASQHIDNIEEIIVATGARPNLELARELRLRLDPWLESTEQLAPLIDPNLHHCGSVPPHGHRELTHPERDYFAIGAKSYGRAPNFLLATGYEQARSVVAALAGDMVAADNVQLELPETGVCITDFAEADGSAASGAGCCPPAAKATASTKQSTTPKTGCC